MAPVQRTQEDRDLDSNLQRLLSSLYLRINYAHLAIRPPKLLTFNTVVADALCYMQFLKFKRSTTVYSNSQKRQMRHDDLVRTVKELINADNHASLRTDLSRVINQSYFGRSRKGLTRRQRCTFLEAALQFIGILENEDAGVLPRPMLKGWQREAGAQEKQKHTDDRQAQRFVSKEGNSVCGSLEDGEIDEETHRRGKCMRLGDGKTVDLQRCCESTGLVITPGHDPAPSETAQQQCGTESPISEGLEHEQGQSPAVQVAPLTEEQYRIDQALKKMDSWADEWLMGLSKSDDDWATFDDCLEQPDL